MRICRRCATHLNPTSIFCPACGAGPITSVQEEPSTPPEASEPDLTPRIKAVNVRSQLSQKALTFGCLAGAGGCFLLGACGIVSQLVGFHGWLSDIGVPGGCMIIAFVAPGAGLLGALAFSQLAESLQILFRPFLHAWDPRARMALRKIRGDAKKPASDRGPEMELDQRRAAEDGITEEAQPPRAASEGVFEPRIQRGTGADDADSGDDPLPPAIDSGVQNEELQQ